MSAGLKIVVALGLALAVLLAGATSLVGGALVAGGVARVAVHAPDGPSLRLAVPGALVTALAATGGRLAQTADADRWGIGEASRSLELAAAGRSLGEMLRALEEAPDATLVEVEDGADFVRIDKVRGHLRVRVIDGGDELDLEVSLPIRTARRAAHLLLL